MNSIMNYKNKERRKNMKKATISNNAYGKLACWAGLACAATLGWGLIAGFAGFAILG